MTISNNNDIDMQPYNQSQNRLLTAKFLVSASEGQLDIVKCLIEEGIDELDVAANDNFAVRQAAANGHLEVVKYLVETVGDKIDLAADNQYAFQLAAENGHFEMVKYLIEESPCEIEINASNNYALRWAISNGHEEMVKYLIEEHGESIDLTADNNFAMRLAITKNQLELVKYFVEECSQQVELPRTYRNQESTIQFATRCGQTEIVKYLIEESGLDIQFNELSIEEVEKNLSDLDPDIVNSAAYMRNMLYIVENVGTDIFAELRQEAALHAKGQSSLNTTSETPSLLQFLNAVPPAVLKQMQESENGAEQIKTFLHQQFQLQQRAEKQLHPQCSITS